MARGLFVSLTQAQVESIRDQAIAALTAGKQVVSYSIAGRSVSKQLAMAPDLLLEEANYALGVINPTDFPACVVVDEYRVTFTGTTNATN